MSGGSADNVKSPFQMLRQQISLTEIMNTSRSDASQFLENMEDTGLQEHTEDNCLYCVCTYILGYQQNNKVNSTYCRTGEYSRVYFCSKLAVLSKASLGFRYF